MARAARAQRCRGASCRARQVLQGPTSSHSPTYFPVPLHSLHEGSGCTFFITARFILPLDLEKLVVVYARYLFLLRFLGGGVEAIVLAAQSRCEARRPPERAWASIGGTLFLQGDCPGRVLWSRHSPDELLFIAKGISRARGGLRHADLRVLSDGQAFAESPGNPFCLGGCLRKRIGAGLAPRDERPAHGSSGLYQRALGRRVF